MMRPARCATGPWKTWCLLALSTELEQPMLSRCEQGGVEFGPITAAYVADGWRGVVATTELQAGDVLLSVPERLLLNRRRCGL